MSAIVQALCDYYVARADTGPPLFARALVRSAVQRGEAFLTLGFFSLEQEQEAWEAFKQRQRQQRQRQLEAPWRPGAKVQAKYGHRWFEAEVLEVLPDARVKVRWQYDGVTEDELPLSDLRNLPAEEDCNEAGAAMEQGCGSIVDLLSDGRRLLRGSSSGSTAREVPKSTGATDPAPEGSDILSLLGDDRRLQRAGAASSNSWRPQSEVNAEGSPKGSDIIGLLGDDRRLQRRARAPLPEGASSGMPGESASDPAPEGLRARAPLPEGASSGMPGESASDPAPEGSDILSLLGDDRRLQRRGASSRGWRTQSEIIAEGAARATAAQGRDIVSPLGEDRRPHRGVQLSPADPEQVRQMLVQFLLDNPQLTERRADVLRICARSRRPFGRGFILSSELVEESILEAEGQITASNGGDEEQLPAPSNEDATAQGGWQGSSYWEHSQDNDSQWSPDAARNQDWWQRHDDSWQGQGHQHNGYAAEASDGSGPLANGTSPYGNGTESDLNRDAPEFIPAAPQGSAVRQQEAVEEEHVDEDERKVRNCMEYLRSKENVEQAIKTVRIAAEKNTGGMSEDIAEAAIARFACETAAETLEIGKFQ
eukprot:TRINITY_DN3999_c0_g2_i1.p1 TRINITY_DN3999_c0_g2~~TRINITY_DN3999_c0_g2_i1.p1  ORF type:complete len:596 (+),score=138.46 TRINITY_DN3999_c0_g2_i1:78-1865(+)